MVDLDDVIRFEPQEDRLTALFMLVLEHTDHDGFLTHFLELCDLADQDLVEPFEFFIQPGESDSRPDGMIAWEVNRILIEVKIQSDVLTTEQLERHCASAQSYSENCTIVAISNDLEQPAAVNAANRAIKGKYQNVLVKWLNWQMIWQVIHSCLDSLTSDNKDAFLLKQFATVLENRELVGFVGFSKMDLEMLSECMLDYQQIGNSIYQLMRVVKAFLRKQKSKIKQTKSERSYLPANGPAIAFWTKYYFEREDWGELSPPNVILHFDFEKADLIIYIESNKKLWTRRRQKKGWKAFCQKVLKRGYEVAGPQKDKNIMKLNQVVPFVELASSSPEKIAERLSFELIWIFETLVKTLYTSNAPFNREVTAMVEFPPLRGFEGFHKPAVENISESVGTYKRLANNVRQLMKAVENVLQKRKPEIRYFFDDWGSPWGVVKRKDLTIVLWTDYGFTRDDWDFLHPEVKVRFNFKDAFLAFFLIIEEIWITEMLHMKEEDWKELIHEFQELDYELTYIVEDEEMEDITNMKLEDITYMKLTRVVPLMDLVDLDPEQIVDRLVNEIHWIFEMLETYRLYKLDTT